MLFQFYAQNNKKNCCTLIVNNLKETLSVGKHAIMHLLIIKWKTKLRKNKTLFINTVNQKLEFKTFKKLLFISKLEHLNFDSMHKN